LSDLNDTLALGNAVLSVTSTVCAILGWRAIRKKRVRRHRTFMSLAVTTSALFMALFVYRFVRFGFKSFNHVGAWRGVYYTVLLSHEPMAVVTIPLVLSAFLLALNGSFTAHRELARVALPIWLFVLVTGVMLYVILYRI
jgi:putative membrane protein